ncbi:hypothetical protein G5I_00954 [Acromyrmex echinatior]|uniref:Uncharacterized protein n=1 Tax=Acromyrmex echinatior TaxID=103372 RepID=F4W661_ACREC|nr:hypothetical protein G5I_00954 [Acromyrmex echinatior]
MTETQEVQEPLITSAIFYFLSRPTVDALIKSEKQRRYNRLHAHYQNDVWEKRTKPPENWNTPLPEWMQKEFENSYLHIRSKEIKQGAEVSPLDTKCTIL